MDRRLDAPALELPAQPAEAAPLVRLITVPEPDCLPLLQTLQQGAELFDGPGQQCLRLCLATGVRRLAETGQGGLSLRSQGLPGDRAHAEAQGKAVHVPGGAAQGNDLRLLPPDFLLRLPPGRPQFRPGWARAVLADKRDAQNGLRTAVLGHPQAALDALAERDLQHGSASLQRVYQPHLTTESIRPQEADVDGGPGMGYI